MSLSLGKSFDRSYALRIPFLDSNYNLTTYFNKKSTFLLFDLDHEGNMQKNVKIRMFKNLYSSKFCESFLKLHNFRKNTLDIQNQFEGIKEEYYSQVSFLFNETVILSKVTTDDGRELEDTLTFYGFFLNDYVNEYAFVLAERQNIQPKLKRKIVRTTGVQLATSDSLHFLEAF